MRFFRRGRDAHGVNDLMGLGAHGRVMYVSLERPAIQDQGAQKETAVAYGKSRENQCPCSDLVHRQDASPMDSRHPTSAVAVAKCTACARTRRYPVATEIKRPAGRVSIPYAPPSPAHSVVSLPLSYTSAALERWPGGSQSKCRSVHRSFVSARMAKVHRVKHQQEHRGKNLSACPATRTSIPNVAPACCP